MKKRNIVIIIIIWILLLTGIILYSKYNNQKKETTEPEIKEIVVPEKETLDKYEYIDYTGYYDENDLKIEGITLNENNFNYIVISGLKDKDLEKEINEKLYNMIEEKLNDYKSYHTYVEYNASNILSIEMRGYKDEEYNEYKYETLNIDLTTGKELKLEDIVNTTNLVGPIANAYYEEASYFLGGRIKRIEKDIKQYNACIESGNDCEYFKDFSIEEENLEIEEYQNELNKIEDTALKYARNFDKTQKFYITSAGIVFPNVNIYKQYTSSVMLTVKRNPRLFNYFYKYKNESIFDGTYSGRKNLIMAEYTQYAYQPSTIKKIEDYAIINYDQEELKEDEVLNKYIETLDNNNFSYIYHFYKSDYRINYISFDKCSMDKELYNNTVKYELADAILNSTHNQGYYSIKNQNASCEDINIYYDNPNVMMTENSTTKKIIVKNNEEVTKRINDFVEEKKKEIGTDNNTYLSIESLSETQIAILITYYEDNYTNEKNIKETFDLK